MKQTFAVWFWYFSIGRGILAGCRRSASFSIGVNDTVFNAVPRSRFSFFALPIAASIAARWLPMIAGLTLLISIFVILVVVCHSLADVLQVLKRPILWFHLMFGTGFVFLAGKIRKPWRIDPVVDG